MQVYFRLFYRNGSTLGKNNELRQHKEQLIESSSIVDNVGAESLENGAKRSLFRGNEREFNIVAEELFDHAC